MIACPICRNPVPPPRDRLAECADCDHLFEHPPRVAVRYDAGYVAAYDRYPTEAMAFLRAGFLKGFAGGGRLLDVGYGNGAFVRAAAACGFDAYGADLHGVDYGVREVSLETDDSRWDVVTFFDSLEHFPEFDLVRSLLRRSRFVLVSLPCRPPEFPRDRSWKHYKPGEHLHYFSPGSLTALVGKPLLARSNVEDAIRRGPAGTQNILTQIYGPPSAAVRRPERRDQWRPWALSEKEVG